MPRNLLTPSVVSPPPVPYRVIALVLRALCHICCGRGQSHAVSAGAAARRPVPQSKVAAVTDQNAPGANSAAGAQTDDNDWRVTVRLVERGQASQAGGGRRAPQSEGESANPLRGPGGGRA